MHWTVSKLRKPCNTYVFLTESKFREPSSCNTYVFWTESKLRKPINMYVFLSQAI